MLLLPCQCWNFNEALKWHMSQPVMRFVNEKEKKNMDAVSHPSFSNVHDFASHFPGGISGFQVPSSSRRRPMWVNSHPAPSLRHLSLTEAHDSNAPPPLHWPCELCQRLVPSANQPVISVWKSPHRGRVNQRVWCKWPVAPGPLQPT